LVPKAGPIRQMLLMAGEAELSAAFIPTRCALMAELALRKAATGAELLGSERVPDSRMQVFRC